MGTYKDRCGTLPTTAEAVGIEAWWSCAFYEAVRQGVCSPDAYVWGSTVWSDIREKEGIRPFMPSYNVTPDGDYVEIWLGDVKRYYMGKFKWKCEVVPEVKFHFDYISKTEQAKPGQHVEAKVRIWNDSDFDIEVQAYIMDGTTIIEKEPDILWKNISVGRYTGITLSTYGPSPDMPEHDWHLDVKVCAREKGWF